MNTKGYHRDTEVTERNHEIPEVNSIAIISDGRHGFYSDFRAVLCVSVPLWCILLSNILKNRLIALDFAVGGVILSQLF
jgi:hypothetical protein